MDVLKSKPGKLPAAPNPIADDGTSVMFCSTCAFSGACLAAGYSKSELSELHCLVEHVGPFAAGEPVFRTRDPFRAIYAVRGGTAKTVVVNREGHEQVLGFYLPGEVIGLNAIYPEHYPCDAVALDPAYFCRFSFPAMSALAAKLPSVQQHLFRMLSKELGMATVLAGDHTADERMAAFLLDLGERYAARGFSGSRFRLAMSRNDIANYLRLAAETVSRVLSRFREQRMLQIDGRDLEILDVPRLRELASGALND
ncbi:MAG: helix-turn-helix domain-containing protein [Rudaea sp.]